MHRIILIFCIVVGGLPSMLAIRCLQPPIRYLESACAVRNLTVYDAHYRVLTNDYSCDASVNRQSYYIDWPYVINFTTTVRPEYKHFPYLLVVVDNTAKQLLWMVSNITAVDTKLTPLTVSMFNRPYTLKPYQQPIFDTNHREHQLEFLVFHQRTNFPLYPQLLQHSSYPFDLVQWLDAQISSGAIFCGPVAGASVRMYDNAHYPSTYQSTYPYPANPNHNGHLHPTLAPPPYDGSQKKNAAFRFNSSIVSLLITVVAMVFHLTG